MNNEYNDAKLNWINGHRNVADLFRWSYLNVADRLYTSSKEDDVILKEITCEFLKKFGIRGTVSVLKKRGLDDDRIPPLIICCTRLNKETK